MFCARGGRAALPGRIGRRGCGDDWAWRGANRTSDSGTIHTAVAEKLASRILALAPQGMRRNGRVFFTSGGSEATETAIKLARQYWIERGETRRFRVISRQQSYHGSTLGALSVSGNVRR